MKTILCYGDSSTWGYSPSTQDRYARDERWGGMLRNALGEGYLVIEEGLGGRTTLGRRGRRHLQEQQDVFDAMLAT
jgi:lysophospholipase L1-like esterase